VPVAFLQRHFLPGAGVAGIWWGLCLGFGCVTIIAGGFVVTSDWESLAARAGARAHGNAIAAVGSADGGGGGGTKRVPLLGSLQHEGGAEADAAGAAQ
jgi:hypothetical protein